MMYTSIVMLSTHTLHPTNYTRHLFAPVMRELYGVTLTDAARGGFVAFVVSVRVRRVRFCHSPNYRIR